MSELKKCGKGEQPSRDLNIGVKDENSVSCPLQFHYDSKGNPTGITMKAGFELNSSSLQGFFKEITGSNDFELSKDIFERGVAAIPDNNSKDDSVNALAQNLYQEKPQDPIEARLCVQAHSLYAQGMKYLSRAESQDMMPQVDFCLKYATKLLRLHNETVAALAKLRRNGEQKVVVQHVNVSDGGQASVMAGNFKAEGGRVKKENYEGIS